MKKLSRIANSLIALGECAECKKCRNMKICESEEYLELMCNFFSKNSSLNMLKVIQRIRRMRYCKNEHGEDAERK
jgi:hypothetical protein